MNKKYPRKIYNRRYDVSHPWVRPYRNASARCRKGHCYDKYGIKNLMLLRDFKYLWFRDKAYLLEQPSIDRINPDKHYTLDNCRFIEKRLNQATPKRISLGMKKWWKKRKLLCVAACVLLLISLTPVFAQDNNGWKARLRKAELDFERIKLEHAVMYRLISEMAIKELGYEKYREIAWLEKDKLEEK